MASGVLTPVTPSGGSEAPGSAHAMEHGKAAAKVESQRLCFTSGFTAHSAAKIRSGLGARVPERNAAEPSTSSRPSVTRIVSDEGSVDADGLNAMFRAFHTIKGVAGFLKITPVSALTHDLESVLDRARRGEIRTGPSLADLSLRAIDRVRKLLAWLGPQASGAPSVGPVPPVDDLVREASAFRASLLPPAPAEPARAPAVVAPPPRPEPAPVTMAAPAHAPPPVPAKAAPVPAPEAPGRPRAAGARHRPRPSRWTP